MPSLAARRRLRLSRVRTRVESMKTRRRPHAWRDERCACRDRCDSNAWLALRHAPAPPRRAGHGSADHHHRALHPRHRHRHSGPRARRRAREALGQPVVVDNKPGASGNIGTQVAARAAPDGQTLLMIAKTFVTNVSLFKNVPYDPVTSFAPVVKLATGSIVLAVHPSVPADSVPAFVQYVKARPGEVNYGSPGFATPHHLAMELFKHATQTNLVHIPYKGTSGVMSDLVGNHVSAMFVPTHVALPLAEDKQIRILGVASTERVAAAPDVPTLVEQGVTGFDVDIWFGLLAPAGTPADVVARYNAIINEFLRSPPSRRPCQTRIDHRRRLARGAGRADREPTWRNGRRSSRRRESRPNEHRLPILFRDRSPAGAIVRLKSTSPRSCEGWAEPDSTSPSCWCRVHRRFMTPMLEDVLQRRPYNAATDFVDGNVARGLGDKIAFTDSERSLTYARAASALLPFCGGVEGLGLREENRVILAFHDTVDHPVAFWGAIRAGIIPIPVNTLLTAEQYAYLFADSRAAAAVVAAPLAPTVLSIRDRLPHLRAIIVVGASAERAFEPAGRAVLRGRAGAGRADTVHGADDVGRGRVLDVHVGLDRRSQGGAARPYQPDGDRAAHGPGHHRHPRGRRCVLGGEAVVLLRPGQCRVVSDVGGRQRRAAAGPADAAGGAGDTAPPPSDHLLCGAVALRGAACASRDRPGRGLRPAAAVHFGRRGAAGASRRALARGRGRRHSRRHRLDRDAADLPEQPAGRHPLRIDRQAGAGYDVKIVDESGRELARGEIGELVVRGPSAGEGYWNQRAKSRRTFVGEWTYTGDKYLRDEDGYYYYCGRTDDMFKVNGMWVSPFEVEAALVSHEAVLEAAVDRPGGRRRTGQAEGVHRAQERLCRRRRLCDAAGAREGTRRPMEISALDRHPARPAAHRDRQDPALQAAGLDYRRVTAAAPAAMPGSYSARRPRP